MPSLELKNATDGIFYWAACGQIKKLVVSMSKKDKMANESPRTCPIPLAVEPTSVRRGSLSVYQEFSIH